MRCSSILLFISVAMGFAVPANANDAKKCGDVICWEVENRFRLFTEKSDFEKHLQAWNQTADPNHILAMEHVLSAEYPHGWARETVNHLCFDDYTNTVLEKCVRDGKKENYLNPLSFATHITANVPPGFEDAKCVWRIGAAPEFRSEQKCSESISIRIPRNGASISVQMIAPDGRSLSQETVAQPRDVLIAGLGDSFTSGEGNPDEPVHLKQSGDLGMCFRRIVDNSTLYLPTRNERTLNKDCGGEQASPYAPEWTAQRAKWLHAPCHRSLYSYQLRAALALALEDPHITVTYIPLGCTGAEIEIGLFKGQPSRERMVRSGRLASVATEAQLINLKKRLSTAGRKPDLIFLSIGGNDIGFAGLVANAIVQPSKERSLLSRARKLVTPPQAENRLSQLQTSFAKLRESLGQIVEGDLSKIVFVPYGNPLRSGVDKTICGVTRYGFDGHPAFGVDPRIIVETDKFLQDAFIPTLRSLASCEKSVGCEEGKNGRMRFADTHLAIMEEHGFCARSANEPQFDTDCFRDGGTFKTAGATALAQPFAHCDHAPSDFAPYAARGRWTRTPNDSFLAAMTYPDDAPDYLKPAFLTDAIWGLNVVVYGGAIHPTAEGHAAMADAALVEALAIIRNAPTQKAGPTTARSNHGRLK